MEKTQRLSLHLSPEEVRGLSSAAKAEGRTLEDFVLNSALVRANETLPDRRHFGLDAEKWTAFMAALEAPPREISQLEFLMRNRSVFESEAQVDDKPANRQRHT